MKKYRVTILFVAIVLLALSAIAFIVYLRIQPPEMSEIARPVATFEDFGVWDYLWLSNSKFEVFQYYDSFSPGKSSVTAYTAGRSSARPVYDAQLTPLFAKYPCAEVDEVDWSLSPDGKYMLGNTFSTEMGGTENVGRIVGIDGSQHIFPRDQPQFPLAWLRDSRHTVELGVTGDGYRPIVRDIDGHIVNIGHTITGAGGNGAPGFGCNILLGVAADGHCLALDYPENIWMETAHIYAFDPMAAKPEAAYYHVTLPKEAFFNDLWSGNVVLSPDGTRIAWVLYYHDGSVMRKEIRRIGALCHLHLLPPEEPNQSLWVSDAYGQHMHLVAVWHRGIYGGTMGWVQWLPDGKHLSFRWMDENWRIHEAAVG